MATVETFPIDQFEIPAQSFAEGQFGKIYRGVLKGRGIEVALKVVSGRPELGKAAAEQEGIRLQRCVWERHPEHVPEVFCDGYGADGDYRIAMAFVHGESVMSRLARLRRLSVGEAIRLAHLMVRILEQLHGFTPPILHSDFKPEHVLLLADGSMKILDFGIAKRPASGAATPNGFLSVEYASPERLEDEARNVHPSDDLWAFGVTLFEMLAGHRPHDRYAAQLQSATQREDFKAIAGIYREAPGALPNTVPTHLATIVSKLLLPSAGHRYRTAREVRVDLEHFRAGREPIAVQQLRARGTPTQRMPKPSSSASVPTMPIPPRPKSRSGLAPSQVVTPPADPTPDSPPVPVRQPLLRSAGMVARATAALVVTMLLWTEGAAALRAERFRTRIPALGLPDVASLVRTIDELERGAVFDLGVRWRVHGAVANRMLQLADPPLADFRQELPVARLPEWRASASALDVAIRVRPNDDRVRARSRYVAGQVARLGAPSRPVQAARQALTRSLDPFREAARLDDSWPDPWLGMARIHAYGPLRDFDALLQDIGNAERRGYTQGRRERSEIGDGFRARADQRRAAAQQASGRERERLLREAAVDYQSCATQARSIAGFADADDLLKRCEERLQSTNDLLGPDAGF